MTDSNIQLREAPQKRSPLAFLRRVQERISNSSSSYLFFCFFIPVVLTYLLYLAMEIHPFGDGSVLVLDLNAQYVYFFEALRNAFAGDSSMLYSFSRALGGDFVGIYAYYLASPLSFLVVLFPAERMLEALLCLFLLKAGLCGWSFGYYLHKHTEKPNRVMIVAFSAMYALCAFAVVHQNNTMWTDALILLPLITLGIERLVKYRRFKLFTVTLFLALWSNFYIGYMLCIYVALYFFYYLIAYGETTNPLRERLHALRSMLRVGICSLAAILSAAFILLGALYSLSFGKNTFSDPSWSFYVKFDLLDFFTKFLPGSYDTVRPEGLPFVYTGLLTLLLIPVYFLSRRIPSREKIASLGLVGIFVFCFMTNPLDLIWHGFQNPNWLNTRYSFMLCFILLVMAYKGFGSLQHVGPRPILGASALLIFFTALMQKQEFETYVESDGKLLTLQTVWLTVIATVVLATLLCLLARRIKTSYRENISAILAAVVCIELFCSGLACMIQFDGDVLYSKYSGYNNFLSGVREISEQVLEDDTSFYRMEKNVHRKVNDNMALKMRGLSNSTSTLNQSTIRFLKQMGYTSKSHWSQYKGGTPVNDSLLGIKYIIDGREADGNPLYELTDYETEAYVVYENPYALSLAYGVDKSITEYDMMSEDSHFERLNQMVSAMLGEEQTLPIFTPVPITSTTTKNCSTGSVSQHHKFSSHYPDDSGPNASVSFTVTSGEGELYFYAPSHFPRETSLYINGEKVGTYLDNDTDRIICLGRFSEGQTVTVKLILKKNELYLKKNCDYFYQLNTPVFEDAFSRLAANANWKMDEGLSDDHLSGTITTGAEEQTILTTIPYDKGWRILLDGKEIEGYESLDALLTFEIPDAGEHTLEMIYFPASYKTGVILSLVGLCGFIALCTLDLTLGRRIRRRREPDDDEQNRRKAADLWILPDTDGTDGDDEEKSIFLFIKSRALSRFKKKKKPSEDAEEATPPEDNGGK